MTTSIYFDNAATTSLGKEVLEAMMPYLTEHFGNPSSAYMAGRTTRLAIETARKTVAHLLGVKPGTIYFTSCGTESNNTAIIAAIRDLGCRHIITSKIEHHAVLNAVDYYSRNAGITYSTVELNAEGVVDYAELEQQLSRFGKSGRKCLVSLMHANNEIGNLLDIKRVGKLCKRYGAIFHSDCVQTVGHYPINLEEFDVHFISASSHKFHGPKGIGILYVCQGLHIMPLIYGGGQEHHMRAGTENVYGIVGFAKALELAMNNHERDRSYIGGLKLYMKEKLMQAVPGVLLNGQQDGLYTVLSVCFPTASFGETLLLDLDLEGIAVSGGSACSSGSNKGSHVIRELAGREDCVAVRFSFSKYNTRGEIDRVIEALKSMIIDSTGAVDNVSSS